MAFYYRVFLILLLLVPLNRSQSTVTNQSQFFTLMKNSLTGNLLSNWDVKKEKPFCNYTGISCDENGYVVQVDISGWSLSGHFPENVCSYFPELRILRLDHNYLHGEFPDSIRNCSLLEELNMSFTYLNGTLPDFSPMTSLKVLDLSYNLFTGDFPISVTNLTNLEALKAQVHGLDNVHGEVPRGLGGSSPMIVLELSENLLSGELPTEACSGGKLQYFLVLENNFSGQVPESYSTCESLLRFRVSDNRLEGSIPEGLLALPHVSIIDFGYNQLNGSIPKTIGNAKNLSELFIQSNKISGVLPLEISQAANLVKIDLSNNLMSGPLPSEIGNLRKLNLLMLQGTSMMENDETMSSSFCSYDVKSFHRISFDQHEIVEAMIDKNIVGHGGSGVVYRIDLSNGEVIAVKKLWNHITKDSTLEDQFDLNKELKTECDVYSFGVVLMELVTGRKPVEADYGESKNIIYWVSTKVETKEGAMEVLDKRLSGLFKDEMIEVLKIAIRCTYKTPANRPTMNEVVQSLIEADPCRFDCCKSSGKAKETASVTKTKNQYDI
ncbi:hypothetical protein C3L33_10795, partial [Rhododendron williamsianum]